MTSDFNQELIESNQVYKKLARLYETLGQKISAFGNSPAGTVASDARIKISDILGLIEREHFGNS